MSRFLKILLLVGVMLVNSHGFELTGGYSEKNSLVFHVEKLDIKSSQIGQITHKKLIQCDNNMSGFIEYSSKDMLTYHSLKPLRAGVKYICKAGKSKIGIKTEPLKLLRVHFFKPNMMHVEFNDMVSKDEVLKNLSLKKVTKLAKSKLGYKIERDDKRHFLLRTDEAIKGEDGIYLNLNKNLKSIYGSSLKEEYERVFDDKPEVKIYKHTKSFVFYDDPVWVTKKDGKIALRVLLPVSFYGNLNLNDFIRVDGLKEFTLTRSRWLNYDLREKYHANQKTDYYIDIEGDFKPNTTYEVSFLKGFGSSYRQLFKSQSFKLKTKDYGSYVGFSDTKKPYISSVGDIGIKSVNVNKVQVVIDRMLEQNLRYYLNFNNKLDLDGVSKEVVNQIFDIGGKKNEYQDHKIPLSKALKGLKKGVYQISLHYNGADRVVKKVFLSDIGISAKVFRDGVFVFANSLKDTSAISGAKVEVFSAKNSLIASGETDSDGIFKYEKKNFYSQDPKSILITKGDEQNFLILKDALNADEVDMYPIDRQKAFVYFQSQLIRPDADLKGAVIIKDKNYKSLKNAPIGVSIVSLQEHKIVYKKSYKTDEVGSFDFNISMEGQMSGRYRFIVRYSNENISSKIFHIKAFLPQKIKNQIKLTKKKFALNEPIEVQASSRYLFGAKASGLKGELRLKAVPKAYSNDKFKNYSFNNALKEDKSTVFYADLTKKFVLDKNGKASIVLNPSIKKSPPSIIQAQLELGVYDDGRKVSTYEDIFIYPYKNMVGLKIANDVLETEDDVNIKTVFIDPLSGKKSNAKLDVFVYSQEWHYSYDDNGYYKWNKEIKQVEHFTINSVDGIKKRFDRSGDYIIVVQDGVGGHSSSVSFSVRGWGYSSISPTNDMQKNEVKFKDRLYKKGDVVKLDIKSPIKEGKILVTLESDKIYWHGVASFKNHHIKMDVPLNTPLKDGVFVSTLAIKSSKEGSSMASFRASSLNFIKPNRLELKLKPTITSKDKTPSGVKCDINVKAKPNSKVLVTLVDDGILQILGQKPPKPYDFFTLKPKSRIYNFDLYDMLLAYTAKGKELNFGSGALAKKMLKRKKHLSPKTGAKRVKPFMYISKLVNVDKSGVAKLSLKIPTGFNGSATVVAINVDENSIGASSKKVTIKDDVIIKPIVPRYGNVGDKWKIKTRIFNTTKKELILDLKAKTNSLLKISGYDKKIKIKPESSESFEFDLEVLGFGKGELELRAMSGKSSFVSSFELPLIHAYPLSTYAVQGQSKEAVELKAPSEYFAKKPNYSLSVSGDVLASLKGASDDLVGYPYGCAEQTSSKMLALLNLEPFLDKKKKDYEAKMADRERFIDLGIEKLASMQKGSGEFGYWDVNSKVNVYASIYASDVLIELKNRGYKVPNEVVDGIKRALRVHVKYFNDTTMKVYSTYLLATLGSVDIASVNYLYDNKLYTGSLPSMYMFAYVLKKAKMDSEAGFVLKQAKSYEFKSNPRNYYSFYSNVRDRAFALYLYVKHFGKDETSDKLFDSVTRSYKELYSTQDRAFVLRAVNEYYKDYRGGDNSFELTTPSIDEIYEYKANIEGVLSKNSIKITPKNDWVSYSFSVYAYLPKPILHEKGGKNFDVYRVFVDENGEEVDLSNLKLGQIIYSKITVKSNESMHNIAIVEQIPSCFEFGDEKLSKFKSSKLDFKDVRDDRKMMFMSLDGGKEKSFYTLLNASVKGKCQLPAVIGEAMYDERVSDYDLQTKIVSVK